MEKVANTFDEHPVVKSSLSEYRQKISSQFFKDIFENSTSRFKKEMKMYRGYHLVGFDGDEYDLPPTEDILGKGYRGYQFEKGFETHYLKMYTVRCVDLLSSVILDFNQSSKNDEISLAIPILENLPDNTLAIYDRFYLSKRLIDAHTEHGQYFLARCKSGSTFKEVVDFYESSKRRSFFVYNGVLVNLVKVKNPNGEDIILATNIDITNWNNKELSNLYTLRWDNETSNRDSTSVLKIEQWHSKFYNGIIQEIYVHLIMMNLTKMTIFIEGGYEIDLETNQTKKSNFKFIYSIIIDLLSNLIKKGIEFCLSKLRFNINRTIEKRQRRSRSYEREVKRRGKNYKNASRVRRRS